MASSSDGSTDESNTQHLCAYCRRRYSRRDACKRHEAKCNGIRQSRAALVRPLPTVNSGLPASTHSRFRLATGRQTRRGATPENADDVGNVKDLELGYLTQHRSDPLQLEVCRTQKYGTLETIPIYWPLADLCLHEKLLHTCLAEREPAQSFDFLRLLTSGDALTGIFRAELEESSQLNFQRKTSLICFPENASGNLISSYPGQGVEFHQRYDFLGMRQQCTGINLSLKALIPSQMPSYPTSLQEMDEGTLLENFFTPDMVHESLESYWKMWHPHWPVIHRPSFDPVSVSPFLLAAMAVMGGRYSSKHLYQKQARALYDLVEIFVFTALDTVIDDSSAAFPSATASQSLEILQAAYIVTVYQNWDGGWVGRRRIRRQRFSQVVEAAQLLCRGGVIHQDYREASIAHFSWSLFIFREQIIRIMTWTYLIDTGFLLYYNIAPRLNLREMSTGLPCPDACFEAETAEVCFQEVQKWHRQTSPSIHMSLYDHIRAICRNTLGQELERSLAHQSLVCLFSVVCAMVTMLLQLDPQFGVDNQYIPIGVGLANWRRVWAWRQIFQNGGCSDAAQIRSQNLHGFWLNCAEFWLLAQTILNRIMRIKLSSHEQNIGNGAILWPSSQSYDEMNMSRLHVFLCSQDSARIR